MRTPLPWPNRRSFLAMTGVSSAAFALGTGHAAADELDGVGVPADPFTLGVASGDPLPDGFVLWTRLAPEPLAPDGHGGMPRRPYTVRFEVAEDESFARPAFRGQAVATPELGHSVHAEVHGLRPGRDYFYRFRVGGELSPVGRTKTAPAPHTTPGELRFATASCQAWYHGHFTAYEHMAREDLDVVFFLGDYVYEYAINATNLWRQGVPMPPAEHNAATITLEQHRLRYSLFKTDPHLRAAHAAAPWVATTDDHEVENNYADELSLENGTPPHDFLRRRAVAYRAFYENLPMRSMPHGPDLPVYRRLRWGRLANIDVLDTRQFRDGYPAGAVTDNSPERHDPRRSILGERQEQWLYDGLRRSTATWNVFAQGVVMAQIDRDTGPGELGRIRLTWEGEAYEPLVDHYAVYGSESADFPIGPQTLLGKTVFTTFVHDRMGGRSRTWHYRVVVVDAAGDRSRPSEEFSAASTESVTVSGRPLATVGSFDHKSLELALAPAGYAQYSTRFPADVDATFGSGAEAGWSYIHPGPMDSWAGRRAHRFTFRFRLDAVPAGAPWLAMWLVDTHASSPGAAIFALNGTPVREVALERGATRGSLEGDATLPGAVLKPSYVEFALPPAALVAGENVLTIDKNTGSWHVYDALGVFLR